MKDVLGHWKLMQWMRHWGHRDAPIWCPLGPDAFCRRCDYVLKGGGQLAIRAWNARMYEEIARGGPVVR
jgi:hypothetical protein